jgi:hypothetical protein
VVLVNEGEKPIKLKVCRCGDSVWRGIFFVIYKFLRVIYVSIWYYFAPFLAIILSYLVPMFAKSRFFCGTIVDTFGQ